MKDIDAIEADQITNVVARELARSITKWDWDDYSYLDMYQTIKGELLELFMAIDEGDLTGEHGAFNEAAHVSATAQKLMMMIKRRGKNVLNP